MPIRSPALVAIEAIAGRIHDLRGHRVLLDADLASLYGVTTGRLNEQVKRNRRRFPQDFMFRLRESESKPLNRSQIATGSQKHRNPRFAPFVFTEHGAIMAAMVLKSERATEVSVYVVRAFVELRDALGARKELVNRLDELEARIGRKLESHDQAITGILATIRQLMKEPEHARRPIGFVTPDDRKRG